MYWVFLIWLTAFSAAHLEAGFDKQVGPYTLEVGWDPANPNVGQATAFKINVANTSSGKPVPTNFSSVWVRFERGQKVWFAGTFALVNGDASFSYSFPETGEWTMRIQFGSYAEETRIVVTGKEISSETIGWVLAGLLALMTVFLLLKTRLKW